MGGGWEKIIPRNPAWALEPKWQAAKASQCPTRNPTGFRKAPEESRHSETEGGYTQELKGNPRVHLGPSEGAGGNRVAPSMRTPARLANSIQLRRKLGTLNRCMGDDEVMAIKEVKKYK